MDWPLKDIKDPHDNDVLYGRGGGTNHHVGNKRYRKMVEDRKIDYVNSKRLDKPYVALEIITTWRSQYPPGRFLKPDEKTGLWHDVGDKMAREKTSQALREKTPLWKKQELGRKEGDADADSKNEGSPSGSPQRTTKLNIPESENEKKDNKLVSRAKLARDHSLGRDFLEPNEAVTLDGFSWQKPLATLKRFDSDDIDSVLFPRSSSNLPSPGPTSQMPQQHHPVSPRFKYSRTEGWGKTLFPAPGHIDSASSAHFKGATVLGREHGHSTNPLRKASISGPARNPFSKDESAGGRQGSSSSTPHPISYIINEGNDGPCPPRTKSRIAQFSGGETTGSTFSCTDSRSDEFWKKSFLNEDEPVSRATSVRSTDSFSVVNPPKPQYSGKIGYSVQSDDYAKFATMIKDDTYTKVQRSWSDWYSQGARSFLGASSNSARGNEYSRLPFKDFGRSSQDEHTVEKVYNRTPPKHYSPPSERSSKAGSSKFNLSPSRQGCSIAHNSSGSRVDCLRFIPGEGHGYSNEDARVGRSRSFEQADNVQRQNQTHPPLPSSPSRLPATSANTPSGVVKPGLRRKSSGRGLMPQPNEFYANNIKSPRPQLVKRETSNQNESQETKRMVKRAVLGRERTATAKSLKEPICCCPTYELDASIPIESTEESDVENDMITLEVSMGQSTLEGEKKSSKPLTPKAIERIPSVDGIVSDLTRKPDLDFDQAGNKVQRSGTIEKIQTLIDGPNGTTKPKIVHENEQTNTIGCILVKMEKEHRSFTYHAERPNTGGSPMVRKLEKGFGLPRPTPIAAGDRLCSIEAIFMMLEDGGPVSRPSRTCKEPLGPMDDLDLYPNYDWLVD